MPFGDKKGPRGQGPKTGRRVGYCAGFQHPGHTNHIAERSYNFTAASRVNNVTSTRDGYGIYKHPFADYISKPFYNKRSVGLSLPKQEDILLLIQQVEKMKKDISEIQERIQLLDSEYNKDCNS